MCPVAHDAFITEIPPENVSIVHPAQTAAGSLNASAPPELCIDGFVEEPTRLYPCCPTLAASLDSFSRVSLADVESIPAVESISASYKILVGGEMIPNTETGQHKAAVAAVAAAAAAEADAAAAFSQACVMCTINSKAKGVPSFCTACRRAYKNRKNR
jgi:hypothetical protein